MGAITFDTLAYAKKLKAAGVDEKQAEVQAEALAEIIEDKLATKQDLQELELRLSHKIEAIEHSLTLKLGAMLVVGISVVATLVKIL